MKPAAPSPSPSERFLKAFCEIEEHLRQLTNQPRETQFIVLLKEARGRSRIVARRYEDLDELRELRNAIVHDGRGLIAEPTDKAVQLVEEIRDLLLEPPRVDTSPFLREVVTVSLEAPVADAVRLMYEKDFSQLPVVGQKGIVDLLTTNTIARWLGVQVAEDIFSLTESSVAEVLQYKEMNETWQCIPRHSTLVDAVEFFEQELRQGHWPVALIITHSGKQHEKPLGIITPWDLPEIYQRIGERR